jgi:ABC-type dipeptide/oligopeptide/nickel transport systems, permease components
MNNPFLPARGALSRIASLDPLKARKARAGAKPETGSPWRDLWASLARNPVAMASLVVVAAVSIIAIAAGIFAPYDPYAVRLSDQFLPPSASHLAGTDMYGRDVLSRIFYGARISLAVGLLPPLLSMTIGAIIGLVAGYYGGKVDFVLMIVADMVLSFPSLLLAIVVMYILGASTLNIFIALAVVGWASDARVVRSQVLSLKHKEFIEASRAIGTKDSVIMFRHLLPNCLPQLLVLFTLDIPAAILSESSLSFLGVGAQPPAASWGLMVSNGREFLFNAPWVAIAPGVAILVTVLAFNFLGDGLRDSLDPYMKN